MRATFSGLEIARTGLTVSQLGLDVTGHNIANVDTAGYTRQRLVNTAYDPAATLTKLKPVSQALVGGGARIKIHDQIRSSFLDRQYRTENSVYSYYNARSQGLTYVQSYFESEAETTLNDNIDKFFGAISTLSRATEEGTQRVLLQQSGTQLASTFNSVYNGLVEIQNNQNVAVGVTVEEINTIAKSLAELNKSIYSYELSAGQYANDLRDKRNLLLDELSSIIDIEYGETGTSTDLRMYVKIAGKELVNHTSVSELGVCEVDNIVDGELEGKKYNIYWVNPADLNDTTNTLDRSQMSSGRLKAYLDLRDGNSYNDQGIPYYLQQVNKLARALVQSVNSIHRNGWTYPSEGVASKTGINFFDEPWKAVLDADGNPVLDAAGNPTYEMEQVFDENGDPVLDGAGDPVYQHVYDISKVSAKNLKLSAEVADSVFNIAASTVEIINSGASASSDKLQSGNNLNMGEIYKLFDRKDLSLTMPDGTNITIGGIYGYMSSITLDMATNLSNCNDTLTNKNILALDADNQRMSISGVSLDEEMTNLIKYQHAYSGASRVINAMDEAIDILINRTGRVGL